MTMNKVTNSTMPLVSVIVPCYNNAPYLRKCIDSLLSQTYRNIEVIVVDDGSTDGSAQQLENIEDKRLVPPIRIDRSGVSSARNIGIEQAHGEYIVFVDGDDWVESNHIEELIGGLSDADCSMIQMQIDYPQKHEINAEHTELFSKTKHITKIRFNELFESYLLSSPCNKIYKASLLTDRSYLRFDVSISYSEDLLFNLEYFNRINSVALINTPTYHYVKHSTSSTGRFHHNTVYTLDRITKAVSSLFGQLSEKSQLILLRHFLWGIINLFHQNSGLTYRQRTAQIGCLVNNPFYEKCLSQIDYIGIGRGLKTLLKIASPNLLSIFLKLKLRPSES